MFPVADEKSVVVLKSEIWANALQPSSLFRDLNPSVDIGLYREPLDCAFT